MSLNKSDEIIDVFYFRGENNNNYVGTLTTNRLIVKYKNTEESFPLNKITSIKINYSKGYYLLIAGIINVLGIIYLMLIKSDLTNLMVNIFFLIVGFVSILLGYWGNTKFYIGQANGNRTYSVIGKNDKLFEFKDKVNSVISRVAVQGNVT